MVLSNAWKGRDCVATASVIATARRIIIGSCDSLVTRYDAAVLLYRECLNS